MAYRIIRNDITKIKADAVVNTANPEPTYMAGTDSAVYLAAGADRLLEERRKIGRIEEGDVAVTPAFDLDAKHIFHTVSPVWRDGNSGERELIGRCYLNCLNKAVELGLASIAFPLIGTGVNGCPKADALLLATTVFSTFLADNDLDITLVVFDNESFRLSDKIFSGVDQFIDENYVEEKIETEYCCEESLSAEAGEAEEPPHNIPGRLRSILGNNRRARSGSFGEEDRQRESLSAPVEKISLDEAQMPMATSARSLDDVVRNIADTWSESLLRMIDERGYTDTEVYKRANVDRKLFSKIRTNKNYQPKKNTAVAFALALKLNLDETKDFLGRAGYALSPSSKFDLIIEYFISAGEYDLRFINLALFEHDQPMLGD